MAMQKQDFGTLLRSWRQRRRFSQLDLANEAEISQRHLSFMESGRSQPSRDMVLRLCEYLNVPLRERNAILHAAGFASFYTEPDFSAPELESARGIIERILKGNDPNPALAVDRNWNLISANQGVGVLLKGVAQHLLVGNVNVLRLSLHPEGLASRILNYTEWRNHILHRLARDIETSADDQLALLRDELASYPDPLQKNPSQKASRQPDSESLKGIAVPLRISSEERTLEFLSTTTVFGTAVNITLAGIVIESFYPSNPETAAAMRKLIS
ncbi:MAG: helix-turn-helix domain-containing protein [Bdellovibrionia bacterium]